MTLELAVKRKLLSLLDTGEDVVSGGGRKHRCVCVRNGNSCPCSIPEKMLNLAWDKAQCVCEKRKLLSLLDTGESETFSSSSSTIKFFPLQHGAAAVDDFVALDF